MVEKSSTCACCGQAVPSAGATGAQGRPTVRVDDDLLVLCNRAHEEARRRGSLRVEIAHVVWCLTIAPGGSGWIESVGLARHELALAADRWLCRADRAAGSAPLQTSAELKLLLREAERDAERAGHGFASPADVLAALIEHGPDLASGAFLAAALPDGGERSPAAWSGKRELAAGTGHTSAPCPGEARLRPLRPLPSRAAGVPAGRLSAGRQLRFDFSVRPRADEGEEEGGDDEAAAGPSRGAGLLERLSRQEHDLAQLRALVARLTERGEAAVAPALKAAPRAEAAVAAGSALAHADEAAPDAPAPGMPGSTRRPWRTRLVQRPLRPSRPSRSSPAVDAPPRGLGEPAPGICGDARAPMQVDEAPRLLQMAAEPAFVSRVEPMPGLPAAEGDLEDDGDSTGDRLKRFYLSPDDDIVRAPSIGPRTAARLIPAGLVLVRDLLACDPAGVAARVAARYITADRIAEWKAQARLVCTIPWLRGTHAQLLVGAGYDTLGKLMRADVGRLSAAILRYSATREGQSILRSAPPPEIDRIACWIENTALAEPARAA